MSIGGEREMAPKETVNAPSSELSKQLENEIPMQLEPRAETYVHARSLGERDAAGKMMWQILRVPVASRKPTGEMK